MHLAFRIASRYLISKKSSNAINVISAISVLPRLFPNLQCSSGSINHPLFDVDSCKLPENHACYTDSALVNVDRIERPFDRLLDRGLTSV